MHRAGIKTLKRNPEIILALLSASVLAILVAAIFHASGGTEDRSEAEAHRPENTETEDAGENLRSAGRNAETDTAWLVKLLAPSKLSEQQACLAEAVYFEARSEPVTGQIAVAEVILNRVQDHRFPDTVCGVVYQGSQRRNACQFSYACDGNPEEFNEPVSYDRAKRLALYLMEKGETGLSRGALFYHTTAVQPQWAAKLEELDKIGNHVFLGYPAKETSR